MHLAGNILAVEQVQIYFNVTFVTTLACVSRNTREYEYLAFTSICNTRKH